MRDLKTQGIILKRIPYQNENTRLFSVLTKDLGKITVNARTAKKLSSNMRVLSPLNICEFELYTSSNGFYKIKNAVLKKSFIEKTNLENLQQLYTIAELLNTIIEEDHPDHLLYSLVIEATAFIEHTSHPLLLEAFKTKLLSHSGTLPNLKYCFDCRTKCCDDMNWITQDTLHIYCSNCISSVDPTSARSQITFDSLKLLHFISSASFEDIIKITTQTKDINNLSHLTDLLFTQLTQNTLRTSQKALTGSLT